MSRFERLELKPPPADCKPAPVARLTRGPGGPIDLDEAVHLAESAMSSDTGRMQVLSVAEIEDGWAFLLQSPAYIASRSYKDLGVGHGLTFVERKTGDVYSSGSGHSLAAMVLGFTRALGDGSGPAQVPVEEQLGPAFDRYYERLLRGANGETKRTARDRFWLHVMDALRLRRLVLAGPPWDELRRTIRSVRDALDEFPLIGEAGEKTRAAFDGLEKALNRAVERAGD